MSLSTAIISTCAALLGVKIVFDRADARDTGDVSRLEPSKTRGFGEHPAFPALKAADPAPLEMMPLMERPEIKRVVSPREAAKILLSAVQDKKTRVYAASEIDDFWHMVRDGHGLADLPCGAIRAALQAVPDVYIGRKQLALEYPEVKHRTGQSRATLYRIPGRSRASAGHPRKHPDGPSGSHPIAGQRPGNGEILNQYGAAA